ncbi:MAG: hypothetical protein ACKOA6_03760 [Actinomycetota bacterium]
MTVLAFDPERLWALCRSLEDLEADLVALHHQFVDAEFLSREIALCRTHRRRIQNVLRSDLADSSVSRIETWVDSHPSWWAKATHGAPSDVDAVLAAVIHDPRAAGALVDDLDSIAPLIYGTHDTDLVRTFWNLVTDPRTTSPTEAGRRIQRLLETVLGDHRWSREVSRSSIDPIVRTRIETAAVDMLGGIAAPWQLYFSGHAAAWSWTTEVGIGWLRAVTDSAVAAADLARGLGPSVVQSLSDLPDDDIERRRRIDEMAFGIGASLALLQEAGIDDAGRDRSSWRTFDQLVEYLPVDAPWPVSIVVDRGATWLDDRVHRGGRDDVATRRLAALTGHQVLAGVAVLTIWRSYWSRPDARLDPVRRDRELRHAYDSIDSPAVRGRITAG